MGFPAFDIRRGLNALISGPKYRGDFTNHSEGEYNSIEWLDMRDKPLWADVEQSCLRYLRNRIKRDIDSRTQTEIVSGFRCSLDPDLPTETTFEWQFDTLNLWLIKDSGMISYPYSIHVGSDGDSNPQYIICEDAADVNQLYLEMFAHIKNWLDSGRIEKSKLRNMTRTQLEEYRDLRG